VTVTIATTAFATLCGNALSAYAKQRNFLSGNPLASFEGLAGAFKFFPFSGESNGQEVAKQIQAAIVQYATQNAPIDFTAPATGTLGDLQTASTIREWIVKQAIKTLYPGVVTVSVLLEIGIRDLAGFYLGLLQQDAVLGQFGTTAAEQLAAMETLLAQANPQS
jgi:hypothetical protein